MNAWLSLSNYFAFAMILISVNSVLVEKLKDGLMYNPLVQFFFFCYIIALLILNPLSEYKEYIFKKMIKENKIDVIE